MCSVIADGQDFLSTLSITYSRMDLGSFAWGVYAFQLEQGTID